MCASGGWGMQSKKPLNEKECAKMVAGNTNCGKMFYFGCNDNKDMCYCGSKKNEAKCIVSSNWEKGTPSCKMGQMSSSNRK